MVSLLKKTFFFLNLICSPNSQALIHVVRDFVLFFCIFLCVCIWVCMAMCSFL